MGRSLEVLKREEARRGASASEIDVAPENESTVWEANVLAGSDCPHVWLCEQVSVREQGHGRTNGRKSEMALSCPREELVDH